MSEASLSKKELHGLDRLNRIVHDLGVGSWRIVFNKDDKPQFILPTRNENASFAIQRRLNDAGIKVERDSKAWGYLFINPAHAAEITRPQQLHAWERLSLEFGQSVAEKRISRLNYLFSGLGLNPEDSMVVLRLDEESKRVFATVQTGAKVTPRQVAENLNEKMAMHVTKSKVYDRGVDIQEEDLLRLTPLVMAQARHTLEKLTSNKSSEGGPASYLRVRQTFSSLDY